MTKKSENQEAQKAKNRDAAKVGMRRKRLEDRDIEIAPYDKSPRRIGAESSLLQFIRSYLPARFALEMSADQLEALARMETAVLTGGQFAQACPRGDGKTERAIAASLWAWLCGHRRYIVIIGADLQQARQLLSEIHCELGDNDAIFEDWPEVAECVRGMDGNANAARYLTINGEPARFVGGKAKLIYPVCDAAPVGLTGNVIEARGLTGSLRGMRHTPKGGTTIRPDLAIIDDPQTDESAKSFDQVATREALINGAIMGMAGPRKKISAICNCTVIRRQDLADKLLDQKRHPEWRGVRFRMVYEWPKRRDMWDVYSEMRREGMRQGDGGAKAAAYYLANQAIMDDGARVGWVHRYRESEVSALQCAYNIICDHGLDTFSAEYQNEPKELRGGLWSLTAEQVMQNGNGLRRGEVPAEAHVLSMGVDVNIQRGINWVITAWTGETAGHVVDYGKFPGGDAPLWDAKQPHTEEQAIHMGLQAVLEQVLHSKKYVRQGSGEAVAIGYVGVDCGYKPETIFGAVKVARSKFGNVELFPIRGVGGKGYHARNAIKKGDAWHVAPYSTTQQHTLFFNTDIWRERAQRGFLLAAGCPGGSMSVWGSKPDIHNDYAKQITAERIVDILLGDRLKVVYVWHLEPGRANDWLDATVYSLLGASRGDIRFAAKGEAAKATSHEPNIKEGAQELRQLVPETKTNNPIKQAVLKRGKQNGRGGNFATRW